MGGRPGIVPGETVLEETSVLDGGFEFERVSVVLEGIPVVLEEVSVVPGGTSVEDGVSVGMVELDATWIRLVARSPAQVRNTHLEVALARE